MTPDDRIRIAAEPSGPPGTTRIGLHLKGEGLVSSLIVRKRRVRIGAATVTMGGIGGVGTVAEHRMKGCSRRVMEAAVEWMRGERFDVATLFGIRDYYTRWGFATVCDGPWQSMRTAEALACPYGPPVRPFEPADMPAILRIYNRRNRTRTLSVVRPPFPDDGFPKGSRFFTKPRILVVTTHRGRIIGYGAIDDTARPPGEKRPARITDRLTLCEIGASDPSAYATILAESARQAADLGLDELTMHLPPDDPFAIFCRRYGATTHLSYPACGALMARIIDVPRCLRKLRRELERRLLGAGLSQGALWIRTDCGSAGLRLARGELAVVSERPPGAATLAIPQPTLTLGLLGVRSGEIVLASEGVEADRGVEAFADALFRPEYPYMWTADHF